jgi:hypothetical protein
VPHRSAVRVAGVLAVTTLAMLALPAAFAGAAANRCARYVSKYPVAAASGTSVVFETRDELAYGCLYAEGRLRRLPGPDGYGVYIPQSYALAGRYVAYGLVDEEPAGSIYTATVYVVDLRTGKATVKNQDAYPVATDPAAEFSFDVRSIALTRKGTVAWLADGSVNGADSLVVRRSGKKVTVLDRGTDVRPGSFAQSADGRSVYWARGSVLKSAALS